MKFTYAYVNLFRYSVAAGAGVLGSRTRFNGIQGDLESTNLNFSMTLNSSVGLDYQINPRWEVGVFLKQRNRVSARKIDHGFGISLGYSF